MENDDAFTVSVSPTSELRSQSSPIRKSVHVVHYAEHVEHSDLSWPGLPTEGSERRPAVRPIYERTDAEPDAAEDA